MATLHAIQRLKEYIFVVIECTFAVTLVILFRVKYHKVLMQLTLQRSMKATTKVNGDLEKGGVVYQVNRL